jgi:hypothetical protein
MASKSRILLRSILKRGVTVEDIWQLFLNFDTHGSDSEDRAHLMMAYLLTEEAGARFFCEAHKLPPIISVRPEYPIAGGWIDLLLIHADASLTAIEIKADGCPREVLTGLGQAIHYSVQLGHGASRANVPAVRRCLAVFHGYDRSIHDACAAAGTLYHPMGGREKYDAAEDAIRAAIKAMVQPGEANG